MSKFWTLVAVLFLTGLALTVSFTGASSLQVNDLETECRVSDSHNSDISLSGDTMSFEGNYPVRNPNSRISYRFSSGNNVVLRINSQNLPEPLSFWNDCLGSAVYDLEAELSPGRHRVQVYHDDRKVQDKIIRVK